uniref:ATP synthase complex subunit 8 n=1 Tax=Sicyopterus parvei TaxID=1821174 RepID=A0A516IBD9_9GOBI|nr:ATP synthase F0 subunit 8 [Sicyopterus parvei]QDP13427.1 ATP synthase F0 subunit 8 [Sicyopterus parvei]QDP13440.1 ATP synthase F0 subunit 8 [Sicyopterus parvei]
MPQLNPAPWFAILVFSWLVFLTIVVPKFLTTPSPMNLPPKALKSPKQTPEPDHDNKLLWPIYKPYLL